MKYTVTLFVSCLNMIINEYHDATNIAILKTEALIHSYNYQRLL